MAETVFDKILDGEIPCHRVYEDDHVLAFLDVNPISRGHTLVIPKERRPYLHELSADAMAALGQVLPRIARAVMHASGADQYNVLQNNGPSANQSVFHVHFHIIPHQGRDRLGRKWKPSSLDSDDAAALVAQMHQALERDPN